MRGCALVQASQPGNTMTSAATPHIAFYAPLKAPDHPVPSGDRLMARQLLAALRGGGADVAVVSYLRSFLRDPADGQTAAQITADAVVEVARLAADWQRHGPPALWFCYHPYYKAPDLIGPPLCARYGVPYVTAESSWSGRRNVGHWADAQRQVRAGLDQAALNICLTARDQRGIIEVAPAAKTARLLPFIDPTSFMAASLPEPGRLVSVAMMRTGDKLSSYRLLAQALAHLIALPWRLTIIGDGPARPDVAVAFATLCPRLDWTGTLPRDAVAAHLSRAALFVWPGCGEAYGLAYLEAQAAGLPVVATGTAGVPEVVEHGLTGLLAPPDDPAAYADAIRHLLTDAPARDALAAACRPRVLARHSSDAAARRLAALLAPLLKARR